MNQDLIKQVWIEAYLSNNTDPHDVFSKLLGVTRQEAKVECYKFIHDTPFLRELITETK